MKSFIKKLSTIALLGFVMSSLIFARSTGEGQYRGLYPDQAPDPTQNITVNGNYGVSTQDYNLFSGLGSLTSVTKNSDNTYTLHTSDQGTRYFLTDASGNTIGTYQEGPAFAGKSTWTLNADGKTSTIS